MAVLSCRIIAQEQVSHTSSMDKVGAHDFPLLPEDHLTLKGAVVGKVNFVQESGPR